MLVCVLASFRRVHPQTSPCNLHAFLVLLPVLGRHFMESICFTLGIHKSRVLIFLFLSSFVWFWEFSFSLQRTGPTSFLFGSNVIILCPPPPHYTNHHDYISSKTTLSSNSTYGCSYYSLVFTKKATLHSTKSWRLFLLFSFCSLFYFVFFNFIIWCFCFCLFSSL